MYLAIIWLSYFEYHALEPLFENKKGFRKVLLLLFTPNTKGKNVLLGNIFLSPDLKKLWSAVIWEKERKQFLNHYFRSDQEKLMVSDQIRCLLLRMKLYCSPGFQSKNPFLLAVLAVIQVCASIPPFPRAICWFLLIEHHLSDPYHCGNYDADCLFLLSKL